MKESNCECEECKTPIYRKPSHLKRYKLFFCNVVCRNVYMSKAYGTSVEVVCDYCGVSKIKTESSMRHSKTGKHYCSNLCKNRAICNNRLSDSPRKSHRCIKEFILDAAKNACQRCGFDEDVKLLDIHHFDGNHNNNSWNNLRCICVMCHAKHHRCDLVLEIPPLFQEREELQEILGV